MMNDPYTASYLAKIRIQENIELAEKHRLLKEIAASDSTFVEYIVTLMSGWLQRVRPAASVKTYTDPKRATAEIPSL